MPSARNKSIIEKPKKKTITTKGNKKKYFKKPIVLVCSLILGLKQSLLATYL
jgi:hypothetical protein